MQPQSVEKLIADGDADEPIADGDDDGGWGDLEAEMEMELENDSDEGGGEVVKEAGGEGGEPPAKTTKRARIRK
jgi:hypothetical protein